MSLFHDWPNCGRRVLIEMTQTVISKGVPQMAGFKNRPNRPRGNDQNRSAAAVFRCNFPRNEEGPLAGGSEWPKGVVRIGGFERMGGGGSGLRALVWCETGLVEGRGCGGPPATNPVPRRGRGHPLEPSGGTARYQPEHLTFASRVSVRSSRFLMQRACRNCFAVT